MTKPKKPKLGEANASVQRVGNMMLISLPYYQQLLKSSGVSEKRSPISMVDSLFGSMPHWPDGVEFQKKVRSEWKRK